jgi:hypothetical protein
MHQIHDMGPSALLPFRRKAWWGFFSPWKNPTASAVFEPANLGTRGQHATSRPPKPLPSWRGRGISYFSVTKLHFSTSHLSTARFMSMKQTWKCLSTSSEWLANILPISFLDILPSISGVKSVYCRMGFEYFRLRWLFASKYISSIKLKYFICLSVRKSFVLVSLFLGLTHKMAVKF